MIGLDQRKSDFWTKIAYVFNQNALHGSQKKPSKVLNSHWNRSAALVSKWCACVTEAHREKPSGLNEEIIL